MAPASPVDLKVPLPQDVRLALVKARLWPAFMGLTGGHKKRLLKNFKAGQKPSLRQRWLERLLVELNDPVRLKTITARAANRSGSVPVPPVIRARLKKEGLEPRFQALAFSYRRGYLGWITGAKLEATRTQRIRQMLDELRGGRVYMKMPLSAKQREVFSAIKAGAVSAKGVRIPAALRHALRSHAPAKAVFEAMRPSCQIEYSAWVASAKSPEVQARRVPKAVQRILDYGRRHTEKAGGAGRRRTRFK